jgi:hypothetical protein
MSFHRPILNQRKKELTLMEGSNSPDCLHKQHRTKEVVCTMLVIFLDVELGRMPQGVAGRVAGMACLVLEELHSSAHHSLPIAVDIAQELAVVSGQAQETQSSVVANEGLYGRDVDRALFSDPSIQIKIYVLSNRLASCDAG